MRFSFKPKKYQFYFTTLRGVYSGQTVGPFDTEELARSATTENPWNTITAISGYEVIRELVK